MNSHSKPIFVFSSFAVVFGMPLLADGSLWIGAILMAIYMGAIFIFLGGGRYYENKKFSDAIWVTVIVLPLVIMVGGTIICIGTGQYNHGWFEPLPAGLISVYLVALLFWSVLLWIVKWSSYPEPNCVRELAYE